MEPLAEAERRQVYYSGRVQGVGFRYTARSIAQQYAVTGYVKNLPDGRVELVVEGSGSVIAAFLRDVQSTMGRYIRDVQEIASRATGGFSSFDVRF